MEGIIQTGNQVRNMAGRKKDPLYKSFGYAFQGIFTCIRKERNMKIHCMVAALVVIAGLILGISVTEWCICLGLFGMVMALELVNTAVEAVVDLVTEERHPLAKIAKDTAAGAVLIAAIMAAIVGLIIFVPKGLVFSGNMTGTENFCFRIGSGVGLWCDGVRAAAVSGKEKILGIR